MKKIFILLLLLNVTLITTGWKTKNKPTPTPSVLKEYPFAMTNEDYNKIPGLKKYIYINGSNYSWIPKTIMGHNAKLCFSRAYKDISVEKRVFQILIEQKDNPRKSIYEYNKIRRLLTKKYGYPNTDKSVYKKRVSESYLRMYQKKINGKELAFNNADLIHISTWEKEKFIIELKCYKYNKYKKFFYIDLAYIAPKPKQSPTAKIIMAKKVDPLTEL